MELNTRQNRSDPACVSIMWAKADRLNWGIKSQGHVEEMATGGTKTEL